VFGFAEFAVWAMMVVAICGCLFVLAQLLRLSIKERKTMAGSGYGARVRLEENTRPSRAVAPVVELHLTSRAQAAPAVGAQHGRGGNGASVAGRGPS
jgi:hypothetical protein